MEALSLDTQGLVVSQIKDVASCLEQGRIASPEKDLDQVGVELEFGTVNEDCEPLDIAEELATKANIVTEFSNSSGEIVSDPIKVDHLLFARMYEFFSTQIKDIQQKLRELNPNARMLRMGLLPARDLSELLQPEKVVSNAKPRYQKFVDFLGNRYGNFDMVLPTRKGDVKILQAPPTIAGDTFGTHFNLSVKHDKIGTVHDLGIAFSWLFAYLSSTSPIAFHREGAWNSRPYLWSGGMSKDKELTPFGPGEYLGNDGDVAILKWLNYLSSRIDILDFDDCGIDPNSPLSAIRLRTGTCWLTAGRIRLGMNEESNLWSYYEFRVPDTALSLDDTMSDIALFVGLMSFYLRDVSSVENLISYDDAEAAYWEIARTGRANIRWEGQLQDSRAIAHQMVGNAYKGLLKLGVSSADAKILTNNLFDRLDYPHVTKYRDMISRFVKDEKMSEAGAVEKIVRQVLKNQMDEKFN